MLDCPDCGGRGEQLPRAKRVEWRARDILRAAQSGRPVGGRDVEWLHAQLEGSRFALAQILSLAQEFGPESAHALRIRFLANQALGLYAVSEDDASEPGD